MSPVSHFLACRSAAAAVAVSLAGCTTHFLADKLDDDISPPRKVAVKSAASVQADPKPAEEIHFAGDIAEAIDAANEQRALYFDAVRSNARTRSVVGTTLIALTAAAVYKGFRSDSESTKRALIRLGVAGASIYGASQFLSTREAETHYLEGYQRITCEIVKNRPILIPRTDLDNWWAKVRELESKIAATDNMLSRTQSLRYQEREHPGCADKYNTELRREFRHLYDALGKARALLNNSVALQKRIETAGFDLRRRIELIVADVSRNVHATEKELPVPESLVGSFTNVAKKYAAIKPVEQADTGDPKADEEPKPTEPRTPKTDPDKKDPSTTPGGGEQSKAQTTLGRAVDQQVERSNKLAAENRRLQTEIEKLKKQKPATAPACMLASPLVTSKERLTLREYLSDLYAQHRKVNAMLIGVSEIVKVVRDVDACRPGAGAVLTLSPDVEELALQPGGTYQFAISGGAGVPRAWLVGASGGDGKNELKLQLTVEGGTVIARVTIPECTPAGTAYLVVTDGAGKQKEEVALRIPEKKCEPKSEGDKK